MTLSRRQALAGLGMVVGAGFVGHTQAAEAKQDQDLLFGILKPASKLTQGGWARGWVPAGGTIAMAGKPVLIDRTGDFLIAFDRDAGPLANIDVYEAESGNDFYLDVPIAPRAWDIENINAPFHPPGLPDADFARIRAQELARIAAARAAVTGAQGWRQDFHWPAKGRISGHFGAQRIYHDPSGAVEKGSYHPGLDIALATGTPYAAPADGVVVLAADAPFTLEGRLLMVDHGMGLSSAFLHSSALLVKEGERVAQGQPLGLAGMTGRATGPHLHWGVRWQEARLDPLLLVGPMV